MTHFLGRLFSLARKTDPVTSHLAAEQIKEALPKHEAIIHSCLEVNGPLTKDGIARLTGLNGTQISRRLSKMAHIGMIKETGQLLPSDSGRKEREWVAL